MFPTSCGSEVVDPGPAVPEQRERGLVEQHVLTAGRHVGIEADIAADRAARDESGGRQVVARPQEAAVADRPAGFCKVKSRALTSRVFLEPLVIVMVEQAVGPRVASPAATVVAVTLTPSSSIVSPAFPTTSPDCFPGKLRPESVLPASVLPVSSA